MMQHTDILNGWYASITEYLIASAQTTHDTGFYKVNITEVKAVYSNFPSVGISSFDGCNLLNNNNKKKSVIIITSYYCCCSSLFIIFRRILIISGKQHQCFA